jgi:hypothetical protein
MATSASGRSDCAPACRTTLTNGNGNAASIKAAIGRPAAPASTFDDVRAGFEAAWGELLPTLAEADFQARRKAPFSTVVVADALSLRRDV